MRDELPGRYLLAGASAAKRAICVGKYAIRKALLNVDALSLMLPQKWGPWISERFFHEPLGRGYSNPERARPNHEIAAKAELCS